MGKGKIAGRERDIQAVIREAVDAGIDAGRRQAQQEGIDYYKSTEKRLYALPVLKRRLESIQDKLTELKTEGSKRRSMDLVRLKRSGTRLTKEEIVQALISDAEADLAAQQYEIETIENALAQISDDLYYPAITGRYLEGVSDAEIASRIPCDERTVRRHRSRLVQILAVWLYGAQAV